MKLRYKVTFVLVIVGIFTLSGLFLLGGKDFDLLVGRADSGESFKLPFTMPLFAGPGGCSGQDCEEFCQQNPQECQNWCIENPEICSSVMGRGQQGEIVDPPNTVITYAKTLNFNSGQFTEEDIIKAKNLGANMITLWPAKIINNDEFLFFPGAEGVPKMINIAYENGLHVELRSSFGSLEIVQDYEKFKTNAIIHVAEYAKFAEEHKVYRIVPFGEIDNHMINHCDKITELSKELLTEMRKHYNGKIGVGVVAPWRDCGFTLAGYDYLTVSVYPQTQTGMDAWLTTTPEINLISVVDWAREVAERSDIKVLHIGETGVINPTDIRSSDFDTVVVSKEKEAEFYQKLLEQVSNKINGVSAFYNSKTNFISINGDPAEDVVRDWYNKL